jgi:hypothetical protein
MLLVETTTFPLCLFENGLKMSYLNKHRWVISATAILVFTYGCNQIWDRSLGSGRDLGALIDQMAPSDRMVIKDRARNKTVTETDDRAQIAETVAFFKKYPSGWVMLSGAGGDYDIFLYRDGQLIGRLGLTASSRVRPGEDTLNIGDSFRRVPASEAAAFAHRLTLPWPLP